MRPGFTLMETLIALAITAMVAVVALEMLASMTAHARRLETAMTDATNATLQTLPMRRAIEQTLPSYADTGEFFQGEAGAATGLTSAPATGRQGRPAGYALALTMREGVAHLDYSEAGVVLFSRPLGAGERRFEFVESRGALHEQWPPAERHPDDPDFYIAAPSLIRIVDVDDPEAVIAAYAPVNDRRPPLRARDIANAM